MRGEWNNQYARPIKGTAMIRYTFPENATRQTQKTRKISGKPAKALRFPQEIKAFRQHARSREPVCQGKTLQGKRHAPGWLRFGDRLLPGVV